jgi:hypothetical protein
MQNNVKATGLNVASLASNFIAADVLNHSGKKKIYI